ncbi:MAG: hypothetical protein KDE59_13625, partial [Anaerolineales bacterium]|nr:hypothetical protein [Anaerolineales bacterium]
MTSPLLQTKLRRPELRPVRVERPALYARLTTGQLQKLTLVVAPAGFGKTALVSGWLGERPAGWLALDRADNEPARFWRYLIAALQTLAAPVGVTALAMLGANPPPPPEALLTSLVNDLAAGDGPLCLILDDYHLIENPAIHDALAFFIEHMPARLHLVLLSRSDPPLPLAGWRASGQLQELRQADLCFSLAEAAEFLNEVMGLALMTAQVEQLAERTEGWVAGLQLAALSLQGHKDPTAFVAAFSGSHRFVMDYLLDEVLLRQSEPVRRFLLQTSILNRLTAGLCAAVTGRSDSAAVLAELERANLFILPLDDERRWYRYHQLFADLLRARLLDEDEATELHQRAARWLAAEGRTAEAINHWLAAEDFAAAAALIEEAGFVALYQGELGQLAGWLAALPPMWAAERPWLGILAGWTALLTGRFPAVAAAVGAAQSRLAAAGDRQGEAAGHLAAIQAYLALMTGDVAAALQNARAALAQLPAGDA